IGFLQQQSTLDPGFVNFHMRLGFLYLRRGDLANAIRELKITGMKEIGLLGYCYGRAGRTADAGKVLEKLETLRKQGRNVSFALALVRHGLGEDAKALDLLDQAVAERPTSLSDLYSEAWWSDLRTQPRVQSILKQMHLVK